MKNYESIERFNKRKQARQEKRKSESYLAVAPDEIMVQNFLNSKKNENLISNINNSIEEKYYIDTNIELSSQDIKEMLNEIEHNFDEEKFNILVDSCKDTVIDSIIKPFGLSSQLFNDKDGGNVTTLHNFEQNITATEKDAKRAAEWNNKYGENVPEDQKSKFTRSDYEKEYLKKRERIVENNKVKGNIDSYTDYEIEGPVSLDHTVSEHEIDKNSRANLFLSKDERSKMANDDTNLNPTSTSINSSKRDKSMDDFLDGQATGAPEGTTNADKFGINEDKARQTDQKAREQIDKTLKTAQFKKQGSELLSTGAKEGFKMGLQQSFGLMMKEFTEAVFYEAKDIYNNGFKNGKIDESFISILKERLTRIANRIISKWKQVAMAFKDGAISGFFSNIVTFIINSFVTTSARIVRIIREGFFSIMKAVKMLISPPEGMTPKEAAHEATKLLASAIVISGGILIEEGLETFIKTIPVIGIFADFISPVIMGIITGLTTTFVVYTLDKLDIFGVNFEEKHSFIMKELDNKINKSLVCIEEVFQTFEVPKFERT